MAKSKKKWVALSQEQLQLESAASSAKMVGDNKIHSAEPIPDHDWVGGTWGLFWSDYEDELREKLEQDPAKYIKKHPEDKFNPRIFEAKILTCPLKEKTPEPVQAPPPPVQAPPPPVKAPPPIQAQQPVKAPPPAPITPVAQVKPSPKDLSVHLPVKSETVSEVVICDIGVVAKFEQKLDEGQNYINKHKEGSNKDLKVIVTSVQCLTCPEKVERPKTPPPTPPDVPCPKLRDNALHPALQVSNEFEPQSVENENNKWSWMKEDQKSAGRTKYRLSMYW